MKKKSKKKKKKKKIQIGVTYLIEPPRSRPVPGRLYTFHAWIKSGGGWTGDPDPLSPEKSKVAICCLRNTGSDLP